MHQAVQQGPPASWGPSCTLGLKAYDAQSRLTSGASDAATAATAATRAAAPPPRASVAPATAAAAAAAGASWLRKCPVCCCSLAACACDAAAIAAEHRRQQQQQQLVHQRRQQLQQQREQLERVNSIQQQQKMLLQQQLNSNDEEDPPLVYPGGPLVSCSYQKRGTDAAAPRGPLTGSGVSWSGGAVSSWQQQQQWPQQQQQRQQLQGRGRSAAAAGSSITGEIQGLLGPRVLAACNQLQQQHQQGSDKAPLEDLMLYKVSPSRSTAAAVAAAVIGATAAPKTVVAAAAAPALCPSWSLQGTGEAPSSSSSSNNNNNREQQLSDCQVALQCLGISQRRQGDRKREGDRETKESLQPSLEAQRSFFSSNWLPGTQQPLAATNTNAAAAAAAAEGAEVQYLPHEARRSPVSPSRQQPAATAAEGLCEPPSSRETAEDRDEGIWQETPQGRRALRAYLIELQTRLAAAEQQATHNFVGCLYREIHLQGLSQQQLLPQGALTVGEPLAEGGPSGSSPDGAGRETQEAADSAKEQQQQLMLLQQQLRLLSSEREHLKEALKRKHVAEMKLRAHVASLSAVNEQLQAEASTLMDFHRLAEAHGPEAAEKLLLQQLRQQTERQNTELKDMQRLLTNREAQVSSLKCEVALCRKALGFLNALLQAQGPPDVGAPQLGPPHQEPLQLGPPQQGPLQLGPPEPMCLPPVKEDRTTQTEAPQSPPKPLSSAAKRDSAPHQQTPPSAAGRRSSSEGPALPEEERDVSLEGRRQSSKSPSKTEGPSREARKTVEVAAVQEETPQLLPAESPAANSERDTHQAPMPRGVGPVMRFTVGPSTGYEHKRDDAVDSAVAALSNARLNKVLFTRICRGVYLYGHLAVALRLSPSGELRVSFEGRDYTAKDFIHSFEEEEFRYLKKKQKESGRAVSLEVCPHSNSSPCQQEVRRQTKQQNCLLSTKGKGVSSALDGKKGPHSKRRTTIAALPVNAAGPKGLLPSCSNSNSSSSSSRRPASRAPSCRLLPCNVNSSLSNQNGGAVGAPRGPPAHGLVALGYSKRSTGQQCSSTKASKATSAAAAKPAAAPAAACLVPSAAAAAAAAAAAVSGALRGSGQRQRTRAASVMPSQPTSSKRAPQKVGGAPGAPGGPGAPEKVVTGRSKLRPGFRLSSSLYSPL